MILELMKKFIVQLVRDNEQLYLNKIYNIIKKHNCKTTVTEKHILVCLSILDKECIEDINKVREEYYKKS